MKNRISEAQLFLIKPHDGLIGFASLVYDNQLYLGSIGIHTKADGTGYRLTYPDKTGGNKRLNIYHPINREVTKEIEQAIFSKLKEVMEKSNDRHYSNHIAEQ